MSERINTPFTNEHFADWCLKMAEKKSPYWYGTCVYKASTSVLNSKTRQYPSHYGSSRTSRYKKQQVWLQRMPGQERQRNVLLLQIQGYGLGHD